MTNSQGTERFNLIFKGELDSGVDFEAARRNLCALLKTDPASIERMFKGQTTCLKRDLTKADAVRLKACFDKTGFIARIVPVPLNPPLTFSSVPPALPVGNQTPTQNSRMSRWKESFSNKTVQLVALSFILFCWAGFTALNRQPEKFGSEKPGTGSFSDLSVPGDGYSSKLPFSNQVKRMFDDGKYDQLDSLANEIRANKSRFMDGGWKLLYFYYGFNLDGNYPQWVFTSYIDKAEQWRRAHPESVTARVVLGQAWYNYAWHERGDGYAGTVKNSSWRIVNERLQKAWDIINVPPASGVADCPERHYLRLKLANAMGFDRDKYEVLFQEAIRFEPEYYVFYTEKAEFLLPRWHGKEGEWSRYMTDVAHHTPGGEGPSIYTRMAWSQYGTWENFEKDGVSWDLMKAGFLQMERNYADSSFILNGFARFACLARDRQTLKLLLKRIDSGKYNPDGWGKMSIDRCRKL